MFLSHRKDYIEYTKNMSRFVMNPMTVSWVIQLLVLRSSFWRVANRKTVGLWPNCGNRDEFCL